MSNTVPVAFTQQFADNTRHLVQQKGSRLRGTVEEKMVNGKYAHFDRLGAVSATERTTRHAAVVYGDAPHSRRRVDMRDYQHAEAIDKQDEIRMLLDPRSPYAQAIAFTLGRKIDEVILDAATGNSASIDAADASSNVALPSTQIVDEDFGVVDSNLTLAKMIDAKRILMGNHLFDDDFTMVTNASAISGLLNDTTITSADYNGVRALVNGEINSFLGFNIITLGNNILNGTADGTDTAPVETLAYVKSGIGLAIGRDISITIERNPVIDADHVIGNLTVGAVRIEEEKVVKIECVQAA